MSKNNTGEKEITEFIDQLEVSGAQTLEIEEDSQKRLVIRSSDRDVLNDLHWEVNDGCLEIKSNGGSLVTTFNGPIGTVSNWFGGANYNNVARINCGGGGGGISMSNVNGRRQIRVGSLADTTVVVDGVDVTRVVQNYLNGEGNSGLERGNATKIVPLKKLILTGGCLLKKIRCSGASTIQLHSIKALDQNRLDMEVSGASDIRFKFGEESYDGIVEISCSGASKIGDLIIGRSARLEASGCSSIKVSKLEGAKVRESTSGMSQIHVKKIHTTRVSK